MDYKWVALSNMTLGVLMSSLDGNIVLIAVPTIAQELPGTDLFVLLWILLGYHAFNDFPRNCDHPVFDEGTAGGEQRQ
jgi:hypothetical protein